MGAVPAAAGLGARARRIGHCPDATPVDLGAEFGVPPGRKVFAIFGRLVPWKGHEVFLKAARLVMDAVPEAHAMIVGDVSDGDPDYGERLRALAGELGIADRTTFTGFRRNLPGAQPTR